MITISGKQNDNEVETSIVHLMQMYTFHIEVLQSQNIFTQLASPPSHTAGWPHQAFAFFCSSSVQLLCGQARKMVQLVGMLASQIQIHIMIHKLIHIFMHIDKMCLQYSCILIKCVCNRMQHKC